MKDVIFLFAPLLPASSIGPYLAPHLLSTILRKNGYNVLNRDLNRAFVDEIANLEYLHEIDHAYSADALNESSHRAIWHLEHPQDAGSGANLV